MDSHNIKSSSADAHSVPRSIVSSFGGFFKFFGVTPNQDVKTDRSVNIERKRNIKDTQIPKIFSPELTKIHIPVSQRAKQQIRDRRRFVHKYSKNNSQLNILQSYYDSLKQENDQLEERVTGFYNRASQQDKQEKEERSTTESIENSDDEMSDANNQLVTTTQNKHDDEPSKVLECEFGGYYDSDGNLLRPPLIVLDPKERYQLYQLKEQMKLHDFWKASTKYMVDPKETVSKKSSYNPRMVETTTQTVDTISSNLKTKVFQSYKKKAIDEKRKNKSGYFVGEFLYDDVDSNEAKQIESSKPLAGYLGYVSKPEFTSDKSETKFATSSKRHGVDDIFSGKPRAKLTIDYDSSANGHEDKVIKIKETTKPETEKPLSVGPSAGFNFTNKAQLEKNTETTKDTERQKEKTDGTASTESKKTLFGEKKENITTASLFGKKPEAKSIESTIASKPSFNFGSTTEAKPTFQFGKSTTTPSEPTTSAPKPAFQFGKSATTTTSAPVPFSFDSKAAEKKEEPKEAPKPLFGSSGGTSFGKSAPPLFGAKKTDSSVESKPASGFSFGKPAEKSTETSTGAFSFGKSTTEPSKPFGSSATKETTTVPSSGFSFGGDGAAKPEQQKKDLSPFSFGGISEPEAEKKEKLVFSFGGSESKPSGLFGSSSVAKPVAPFTGFSTGAPAAQKDETAKPAFSFGSSTTTNIVTSKPSFTFGETKPLTNDAAKSDGAKPSSIFGGTTEKKLESSIPLAFGGASEIKTDDKKPFSFGSITEKKEENKTGFSFGSAAPEKEAEKKPFPFGSITGKKEENKTGFSFGSAAPEKEAEKKPFSFGATTGAVSGAFGQPATSLFSAAPSVIPTSNTASLFGAPSTTTVQSTTTSQFGASKNESATGFSFGGQKPAFSSNQPSTAGFSFGGASKEPAIPTPSPAATTGFNFGAPTQPATQPFSFNTQPNSSNASREPTPAFGSTTQAPSRSATPGFNFGNTATPAFGNANPGFGGSNNNNNNNTFGQPSNTPNPSGFSFGGAQNSAFAAPAPAAATPGGFNFNRSASGTPAPGFQTANNSTFNFGGNTPSDPSQVFGAPQPGGMFGASGANFAPAPATPQNVTPIAGRKLAQMRRRRG